MSEEQPNSANGRSSYDSVSTGVSVAFFNRNATPYPTEVGAPQFAPVPVTQQKDIMINAARLHAQQEYDRIMELVSVLQRQAEGIKRRLDLTDQVHGAKYDFKLTPGKVYWLVWDTQKEITRLAMMGPGDWSTGPPKQYQYLTRIRWLGDYTWQEVGEDNV